MSNATTPPDPKQAFAFAVFVGELQLTKWHKTKKKANDAFAKTSFDKQNPALRMVTRVRYLTDPPAKVNGHAPKTELEPTI